MSSVFGVVLPIFAIIALGCMAGRFGGLGDTAADVLNKFVYWIALPPVLFLAMSRLETADLPYVPFVGAFLGSTLAVWALIVLVSLWHGRGRGGGEAPVAIMRGMNASFGNTGYMGIPLFVAAFGTDGLVPASLGTVLTSAICIGTAVISLEATARAGRSAGAALVESGVALVRNPLIMASATGLVWGATGGVVPAPLATLLDLLAAAASPCALFAIGLFLAGRPVRADLAEVGGIVAAKTVLHPLLCWILAVTLFPMDPFWMTSAVLLAALPTGSLTFVIAQRYGLYADRSSSVVVVSTAWSLVSLSVAFLLFGIDG